MKVFASIMAFVVLFLSVQPALEFLKQRQKTECGDSCCSRDSKDQPAKNQCSDICNPFQSCDTCVGCIINFSVFKIFEPFAGIVKLAIAPQPTYSQFTPDFWQPPKIA